MKTRTCYWCKESHELTAPWWKRILHYVGWWP